MYKLGERGLRLITGFEELRLNSYKDVANVWTIGYGTTRLNGFPVTVGMTINEPVADALFNGSCEDILFHLMHVVFIELNQNQVDSLTSFCYNLGKQALTKSSLLTAINNKLIINEDLFTRWNKAHVNGQLVELDGLTRRRKDEFQLYMSKEGL